MFFYNRYIRISRNLSTVRNLWRCLFTSYNGHPRTCLKILVYMVMQSKRLPPQQLYCGPSILSCQDYSPHVAENLLACGKLPASAAPLPMSAPALPLASQYRARPLHHAARSKRRERRGLLSITPFEQYKTTPLGANGGSAEGALPPRLGLVYQN